MNDTAIINYDNYQTDIITLLGGGVDAHLYFRVRLFLSSSGLHFTPKPQYVFGRASFNLIVIWLSITSS